MPFVNDSDLAKSIRNNEFSKVYYFYGKDISTIELYTKRLVKRLVDENNEFCYHKYDGTKISLSDFYDDCEFLPFGADRSVVTVNDLNAEDLSADDLNFLTDTIANLPDTTTVIFYTTGIDICAGKKFPTTKNKKLVDVCSKNGFSCEFPIKTTAEMCKSITQSCQKQGASISKAACEHLLQLCLNNSVLVNNEINKLCSFVNGGEITIEIIDDLVSKQLDTNAFELAKAAVKFNRKKAMVLLNELFEQQLDCIPVLSALSMSFIDLYRARVAVSSGRTKNDICNDFNYKGREFAVDNSIRDCSNIPIERIRRCIAILAQTDYELKSARTDGRLLIEKALIKMMSEENSYDFA